MSLLDVVGQGPATSQLLSAVRQGRLHHALLFSGPSGVGKFATANALCALVLCDAHQSPRDASRGCGACRSCEAFEAGTHPDHIVLLPDEKGAIKIDEVREATRDLRLRSVHGRARFLVIRDAEAMTPQAQNALLKTLEEPPRNAHLILTTSSASTLLLTVRSRCQKVQFFPLLTQEIVEFIESRLGIDSARAHLVAAASQGSPGRAASWDLAALFDARDRAKALDEALVVGTPSALVDALRFAESLVKDQNGVPLSDLLDLLLVWLRDQLVLCLDTSDEMVANADRLDDLRAILTRRSRHEVLRRTAAVFELRRALDSPFHPNAQMLVENFCLTLVGHRAPYREVGVIFP